MWGRDMLARIISTIYHRLPIKSGLTRLSFNPFVNGLFRQFPPTVMAKMRDGTPIEVEPNDYHGRVLYLFGSNDLKVAANVEAFLRPGDTFLDIGANYSTIGFAAARTVGPLGSVHLFEPQKRIAERVAQAIIAGDHRNVHLHRIGLLDEDGEFTIYANDHHSGLATFAREGNPHDLKASETCQVREIGAYVGPLVEGRPFGVKLDIEGAEPRIMPWLLAQQNMRFIVFEGVHNPEMLYKSVRASGLVIYGLCRSPLRLRIQRVDSAEGMNSFHDLVAVRLSADNDAPALVNPRTLAKSPLYAEISPPRNS
jgi:FkbM family methyltransferase